MYIAVSIVLNIMFLHRNIHILDGMVVENKGKLILIAVLSNYLKPYFTSDFFYFLVGRVYVKS